MLDWPAASTDPEYLGCYADKQGDRVMGDIELTEDNMTSYVCRAHCKRQGATYYSTQVHTRETSFFECC